jgi:hypothetical protein
VFCCAIFVTKDFCINTLFFTSLNLLSNEGSMKYLFLLVNVCECLHYFSLAMHNNTFPIQFCKTFVCLNLFIFGFVEISCEKWKFGENENLTNVK